MSFIFLLLYIVAIYIRPQEWVPAIYAWPLIYILAITTAVCLFFEATTRGWARIKEVPNMLLLAFFGCVLMSHISHMYFQGMVDSFNKFLPNVIMFFLFVNVLTTERRIKITIWFIILLSVILALQGIHQWNTGIGWAGQPIVQQNDVERGIMQRINWIGIFNDPNDLALALVVAAGFLASFIFSKINVALKAISGLLLAVLMQALHYTNSRGGYLAMAATVGFFFLLRMKNKISALIIGGILGFVVIIVGPARMSQISATESSAFGRINSWFEGFQMLKRAPLFGVGYGMWGDYHSLAAHNSYILVAAEEGMIGFFLWMALIYICFKGLSLIVNKKTISMPYALGLESSLFGFLAASYFLSRSYVTILYVLLAMASAYIFVVLKQKEYVGTKKDMKISALLATGMLVLVWISMRVSLRIAG